MSHLFSLSEVEMLIAASRSGKAATYFLVSPSGQKIKLGTAKLSKLDPIESGIMQCISRDTVESIPIQLAYNLLESLLRHPHNVDTRPRLTQIWYDDDLDLIRSFVEILRLLLIFRFSVIAVDELDLRYEVLRFDLNTQSIIARDDILLYFSFE